MAHPVAFHAFIYATSMHLLDAHDGHELQPSAPMMRQSHKYETIRLVNEELRNLSLSPTATARSDARGMLSSPSEALIMAVTILAIHGRRDDTAYPYVHPMSPLAEAQHLHVYGHMVNDDTHIKGIILLIKQKGGLQGMELYGMADTLAL
jgi:hypothetical protein